MPPTRQWATGEYLGERLSWHRFQLPALGHPESGESLKLEAGFYSMDLPDLPRRHAFLLVQTGVALCICSWRRQAESKMGHH